MANERITNNQGLNLAVAVWLAHDEYDYVVADNYISVTTIIKPVRQIVLPMRIPVEARVTDISERIQSRFGQALHSSIEMSWKDHYKTSLKKLGTPQKVIDLVRINPETVDPDCINVFTEVRSQLLIGGYTVGGKFDLVIDGRLQDVKKTSVWGYQAQKGIDTYWKLQGSLYRLLNQEKITHDNMYIQYILTDWSKGMGKRDPNYPPHALPHRLLPLMGITETRVWLTKKLAELDFYKDKPDAQIPECSDEDLWRGDSVYKYYSKEDAPVGSRSTKNFDTMSEAMLYKNEKGKGRVDVQPGYVKACNYCPASPICGQRAFLAAAGHIEE